MLDGGEQVDAVPMPAELLAWMKPFVAEHYKPEARRKVRRNDPFRDDAGARARPAALNATRIAPSPMTRRRHPRRLFAQPLVAAQARSGARASATPRQRAEPEPAHPVGHRPAARPPRSAGGIAAAADAAPAPLPPVDSLTFDSDFTPFLQPKVDEAVKREALQEAVPRSAVQRDGRLDVYIDDYSKPDPISARGRSRSCCTAVHLRRRRRRASTPRATSRTFRRTRARRRPRRRCRAGRRLAGRRRSQRRTARRGRNPPRPTTAIPVPTRDDPARRSR